MRYFPYDPTSPLPAFFYDKDNFLERYGFNINQVRQNVVNRPHYHDFFQVYYVLSGSYKDTINGNEIICKKGDVVLTMPYTVHALDTSYDTANPPDVISFSFHASDFIQKEIPILPLTYETAVYKNKKLSTHFCIAKSDREAADTVMKRIYSEYQKKSDMFLTKIFDDVNIFLSLCSKASFDEVSEHKLSVASNRAKLFYDIVKEIKYSTSRKWLIDDTAKGAMMSRSTFTKNFREVIGMSYHETLIRIRLVKAVDLMRYTKKSIAEIANEVGFSSNAHFTKECIKMFTIPPQLLRRKMAERTRMHQDEVSIWDTENAWSNIRSSELRLEHFNNAIGKKI